MLSDHSKVVTPLPLTVSIPLIVVFSCLILVALELVFFFVEPPSIWKMEEMKYVVGQIRHIQDDWRSRFITSIRAIEADQTCEDDWVPLFTNQWPGFVNGCDCI